MSDKMESPKTKRTRLSSQDRRNQLLDTAQTIISSEGLGPFTMELLARKAQVSNPLVYKYFESRLSMLQELLTREYTHNIRQLQDQIDDSHSYEEVVELFVTINFEQYAAGNIVSILRSQPDIDAVLGGIDQDNSIRFAKFLIRSMASKYDLPNKQAEYITRMASAASLAAAEQCNRSHGDRDQMIASTIDFIFNGISAFRR